jgi:hypothetical protein
MFTKTIEAVHQSFVWLKNEFGSQVDAVPCAGQRHHKEQNAAGRAHITLHAADLPPQTQGYFQAVRIVGKRGRKTRKLVLIDGYHRLAYWMSRDHCPFPLILVLVYEIHADTEEEEISKVDALARTIDSKKAAKTNSERWCSAVRDAGLGKAKSKAYSVGLRANSYFKRVLLNAQDCMLELTARARKDLQTHIVMDELFAHCERDMKVARATELFHAGVQTAFFRGLVKLSYEDLEKATPLLKNLMVKLETASSSRMHSLVVLSPTLERLYERLMFLATPEKKKELRAIGNTEEFYNAVEADLKLLVEDFCASLAVKVKSRARKVV